MSGKSGATQRSGVLLTALTSMFILPGVVTGSAAPLPWAPPPVNVCGETGFDPQLRLPNPNQPPRPLLPPTVTIQYPVWQFVPVRIPGPIPDNTRIASQPLPVDPCVNPCPELTGGKTHTGPTPDTGVPASPTPTPAPTAPPAKTAPPNPPPPTTPSTPPHPSPPPAASGSSSGPASPRQQQLQATFGIPSLRVVPDHEPIPLPVYDIGPDNSRPHLPPPPVVHPPRQPAPQTPQLDAPVVGTVAPVGQVTGPGSPNRTDVRWQVYGTDLGLTWQMNPNKVAVMFGDTFNDAKKSTPGWRSNVLGFSSNHDLSHGLTLDSMVQDAPCHAAELLDSRKINNFEMTTIPTSGFAIGNRQYVSYMSVRRWSLYTPGMWWTNYGGIAYSDDDGQTWTKDDYMHWDNIFGRGQFQVAAMVPQGDYVYMFGTPNGRLGSIGVARVPKQDILNKSAYQYWCNGAWGPTTEVRIPPDTPGTETSASRIVPGVAGELSVRYDDSTGLWQMSYLDVSKGAIELRESTSPQGVWSAPATLVNTADYPAAYGGFLHPWSTGKDLYFTISEWGPYNVFLVHAALQPKPAVRQKPATH